MSFKDHAMEQWTSDMVKEWIKSLPEKENFNAGVKQKLIVAMDAYKAKNNSSVTGEDIEDAEPDDIMLLFPGVDKKDAKTFAKRVQSYKQGPVDDHFNNGGNEGQPGSGHSYAEPVFTLNLSGAQSKSCTIKQVRPSMTVADLKKLYLIEQGNEIDANKYAGRKWAPGQSEKEKVTLYYNGEPLHNDKLLSDYGIDSPLCQVHVTYRVRGGSKVNDDEKFGLHREKELEYDSDDGDLFRKRRLRFKKYKNLLKRTNAADCIMGYTNADNVERAEMPCGCAIASYTMWRYMISIFEKDLKTSKMYCPTPRKECKGTDKQRLWDWKLVFAVADLSEKEIEKYGKVINNRASGCKSCPHCGAVSQRPDDLRIWRVRCAQCNKADWCWLCLRPWRGSSWGAICGNKNCKGDSLRLILEKAKRVKPNGAYWSSCNVDTVPQTRCCPKCLSLIEYTDACKHMTCLGCPHEFCFNCLKPWKGGSDDSFCNGGKACTTDPIQKFT
eukprot:CAMPEP_0202701068 /NCGR_PEP_ID=MMETSP1385-20130828/14163_1 /ASSEMBLY_ACC=CAM_ASM_000861 /TAXON_ID=933848 /ORGANISM="Elphidium margaritaceum" /LENGTH=496 /DNA_ID=CAMNT_0049358385 /DNA_START=72 /DNA_END=1562 /DNA_ORIENTATION=-